MCAGTSGVGVGVLLSLESRSAKGRGRDREASGVEGAQKNGQSAGVSGQNGEEVTEGL